MKSGTFRTSNCMKHLVLNNRMMSVSRPTDGEITEMAPPCFLAVFPINVRLAPLSICI